VSAAACPVARPIEGWQRRAACAAELVWHARPGLTWTSKRNAGPGPDGKPAALDYNVPNYNGVPLPSACVHATQNNSNPQAILPCLTAHGYQGSMIYQPATRFWAFRGIETGIFVVLAAVLIGITFLVLSRRDA
jgi:hypothetical protein